MKKGHSLSKYGYSTKERDLKTRRQALAKAVNAYGPLVIFRKLNALYVFNKNKHITRANLLKRDRNWVRKTYMNSRKTIKKTRKKRKSLKSKTL